MRTNREAFYCGWLIALSGAIVMLSGYLLLLANGIMLACLAVVTGVCMMLMGVRISQAGRVSSPHLHQNVEVVNSEEKDSKI